MRSFSDSIKDTIYGEQISNNLWRDNNGQLICENVVLARTGYYDYRESELIEDGSPDKIVKVYRSPEEVFDPISMKSMNYKPLVDDHPEENVTPETVSYLQKGFMTNIRRGVGEFDGCLMADIVATDPVVIDEILTKKKRDLSVGYTADIEEVNGQYIMKNIRGNHIALCEAGRAGVARIRDSIDVKDKVDFDKTIKVLKEHLKGIPSGAMTQQHIVNVLTVYGGYSLAEAKDFASKHGVRNVRMFISDAEFEDFEANGSFNNIGELRSYYPGASVEARGKDVIVRLLSGTKLLYSYLNGSDGKLLFIRKVNDSIRDGVEVLGDSHKLRVGQRIRYFGTPCVVESIIPDINSGEFIVQFGAEGNVCGRLSYDEVVTNINQGKIKLLDSVVFDSEAGEFKFESTDCDMSEDYADNFKDKFSDCFADKAGALRSFRVSVGDKKFDTRAHSAAEAMAKVRAAVKDGITSTKEPGRDAIVYVMQSDIDPNLYFYIGKKFSMREGMFGYDKYAMNETTPEALKSELLRHGWHQVSSGVAKVID